MAKFNISSRKSKLRKLCADFPLFPHATGRWAKTIRQKLNDFGKVTDDPVELARLAHITGTVEWHLIKGRPVRFRRRFRRTIRQGTCDRYVILQPSPSPLHHLETFHQGEVVLCPRHAQFRR